jgi:signal transduction histidine kinase
MTESGRKKAAASADASALAARLEQGPLETLEALKSRLAVVASRGVADLRELSELDKLASTALKELDEIVLELPENEPPSSADFWVRLGEVCGGFHSSSALECRLVIPQGHTRLPAAAAEILLRVIGELLTNVRKHACANSVEVSSAVRSDGAVVFTVKDDGIGLSAPERIRPLEDGTFGLWSIRQRLQEIGAFMELTNDAGLCARVVLPPQPRIPL